MVFLKRGEIRLQMAFEYGPQGLVFDIGMAQAMAGEDAAGVGVDDKDCFIAGIQEDIVGGFRTDAVDGEQFFSQAGKGKRGHGFHASAMVFYQVCAETAQARGFDAEKAGRTKRVMQGVFPTGQNTDGIEQITLFEV